MEFFASVLIFSLWLITLLQRWDVIMKIGRWLFHLDSWLGYITVGCLKYLWFLICVGCFYELIVYLVNMHYERPKNHMTLRVNDNFDDLIKKSLSRRIPTILLDSVLLDEWKSSTAVKNELGWDYSVEFTRRSYQLFVIASTLWRRYFFVGIVTGRIRGSE